jgi:hypothetical protein
MIFIRGDVSDGSDNDRLLQSIIGSDWKILTGADQPIHSPGASPGYNHGEYWPEILLRAEERKKKSESEDNTSSASPQEVVPTTATADDEGPSPDETSADVTPQGVGGGDEV